MALHRVIVALRVRGRSSSDRLADRRSMSDGSIIFCFSFVERRRSGKAKGGRLLRQRSGALTVIIGSHTSLLLLPTEILGTGRTIPRKPPTAALSDHLPNLIFRHGERDLLAIGFAFGSDVAKWAACSRVTLGGMGGS